MFVKPTNAGLIPVYIEKADDLSQRIPNHDRWLEAKALGATQVFAHMNINAFSRNSEEQDLISYWNPPLNKQYRTGLALGGIGFDAG